MNLAKIEPIVKLLITIFIFLVICMFACEVWFRSDGAYFQAIFSMASSVLGAILGIVKVSTGTGGSATSDSGTAVSISMPPTQPITPVPPAASGLPTG